MASQTNSHLYSRSRQPSDLTLKVQALLKRYPNLREAELATLIEAFPHVPILDVALMSADDRLSDKFEAFHRDHGNALKTPLKSLVAFLAVPAILASGILWWLLS